MVAGSIYLLYTLDNTPLDPCIEQSFNIDTGMAMSELQAMLITTFRSCYPDYMGANFMAFIVGGAIAAGPPLVYVIARYTHGLTRCLKGYRIAQPLRWF
jgi:hypothetical protein